MNKRKKYFRKKEEKKLNLFSLMAPIPSNERAIKDYLIKLERKLTKIDVVESFGYNGLNDFGYLEIDPRFFSENYKDSKKNLPRLVTMISKSFDKDMVIECGKFELRINRSSGTPKIGIYENGFLYSNKDHKSADYYGKKFVKLAKKEAKNYLKG